MRVTSMQRLLCIVALSSALAISSGCGKQMVTGGGVSTVVNPAGDQLAEVYLQIDPGQIIFPTVTLPIFNPTNPSINYGTLSLRPLGGSKGEIRVGVNLTTIATLPAGNAVLPNGTPIPVLGANQTRVLSIPVPNTRFVVYVAIDLGGGVPGTVPVAMIGAALPFVEFDAIGQAVGNSNLFLSFNLPRGIVGTAGLFGGAQSGKSGIGMFVDVSGLIQELVPPPASVLAAASNRTRRTRVNLRFADVSPGSSKERKIQQGLDRMSRNRVRLTLR